MAFFGTSTNESPLIAELAGAAMASPAGKCVKYDASGNAILCATAGEEAVGILSMQTPEGVASGDTLTVQIKDGCIAVAGAAFSKGALLAVDANAKLIAATDGAFILAQALDAASAANALTRVQITKSGFKPVSESESGSGT